jgi:hypothetical protein
MQQVFKTRHFERWMRKTELTDQLLCKAVLQMRDGLIDANLGGNIIKKRIAISGRGKSKGIRTLVATAKSNRWFFIFGFAKNERANISDSERESLQSLGGRLLNLSTEQLKLFCDDGSIMEICHGH